MFLLIIYLLNEEPTTSHNPILGRKNLICTKMKNLIITENYYGYL